MTDVAEGCLRSPYEEREKVYSSFMKKGIFIALLSGVASGLYSVFMSLAMSKGVWVSWLDPETSVLSVFTRTYMLGALGSAICDICSAAWAVIMSAVHGKLGDFFRCIRTKPGKILICAALVGGPVSSTAYVIGLNMAGSVVIPVTALCPAAGAVLGRIFYKQKLDKRIMTGIAVCVAASALIGSTGMGDGAPEGRLAGICISFIAALGWGIEGCIAGYSTAFADYEIGITIRQLTSGISNLFILVPVFALLSGDAGLAPELAGDAFTSFPSMIVFVIGGFFNLYAHSLWYKGNSMCGAALGMACNATFSFWGPFFCWIILGLIMGLDGWSVQMEVWAGAVIMVSGIFIIALDPAEFIKKLKKDRRPVS